MITTFNCDNFRNFMYCYNDLNNNYYDDQVSYFVEESVRLITEAFAGGSIADAQEYITEEYTQMSTDESYECIPETIREYIDNFAMTANELLENMR